MDDPYQILGVSQEATTEEITDAYRKRAMASHPDQGGDAAEFREITVAYGVLSDPGKRQRYDESGFAGEKDSPILEMLVSTLNGVLSECESKGINPEMVDLLGKVEARITAHISTARDEGKKFTKDADRLTGVAGRFFTDNDQNFLTDSVMSTVNKLKTNAGIAKQRIKDWEACAELLKHYSYRHDGGESPSPSYLFQGPTYTVDFR